MVVILIFSNMPLLKAFAASKNERGEYLNCADATGAEAESGDAADTAKNEDLPELDGKIDEIISSFSEEDFKFLLDELNEITGKERTLTRRLKPIFCPERFRLRPLITTLLFTLRVLLRCLRFQI